MFNLFDNHETYTERDAARLRRVERKLDLILQHLGVEYVEGDGELPENARALADVGNKIAAIAAHRQATGAGLAEAKRAVEGYVERRAQSQSRSQSNPRD